MQKDIQFKKVKCPVKVEIQSLCRILSSFWLLAIEAMFNFSKRIIF